MALWTEVAVANMRIPGSGAAYMDTYALNDDQALGRSTNSSWTRRAALIMGRYASPTAFTVTNPDYSTELSWYPANDPIRSTTWTRINYWNQIYMGSSYGLTHASGWVDNTRVMFWDCQTWVKIGGVWSRYVFTDNPVGQWMTPNYATYLAQYNGAGDAWRLESSTGYPSVRTIYDANVQGGYWMFHGYSGLTAIVGTDIQDVVSSCKVSLVLHDTNEKDDRQYSRFLFACGADYYPATALSSYPGVGISRHKFVTARFPSWEYRVMHTMTESQFNAAGGHPSDFDGLSEGDSGVVTPPTPQPTRGTWFAKLSGGNPAWASRAVSNTAASKIRRRRGNKIWS